MTSFFRWPQLKAPRAAFRQEMRPWMVGLLLGLILGLQLGLVLWVLVEQSAS